MVRTLTFVFLLLSPFLFSGEFTASVNRKQISVGDRLILTLTLKDAAPQGSPSVAILKNSFLINSQQQSSNTMVVNGHFTSNITWRINLTPQKEGDVIIPPITINTSNGMLSSEPVRINVVKGNPSHSDSSDINGVAIATEVNLVKPYKNETIFYTIRLTSKHDLMNVKALKFNVENAILESNGEPKTYQKIIDGINVGVIEFSYLITPLKEGPLRIPSITIQGTVPMKRQIRMGSFFDDDFDSFFSTPGFEQLKPFTLTTEEINIDVQPPIAGINPWLPAKSLYIEENWNETQALKAGEPIVRTFKIVGEGILSSQLPSLNDRQINDNSFKIYADKPETKDEIRDGKIHSIRKEQYTLIPQHSGNLTLPEISISWWDVAKNKNAVATVPARSVEILAGPESSKGQIALADEEKVPAQIAESSAVQRDPLLYALMAGLGLLLFAAILWVIALQKKIARITEKPREVKSAKKLEMHEKPHQPINSAELDFDKIEDQEKWAPKNKKDKNEKLPDLNPT